MLGRDRGSVGFRRKQREEAEVEREEDGSEKIEAGQKGRGEVKQKESKTGSE